MYENFYGFKEKPFNVTPDTKYFFASEKHEEALDNLYLTIAERRGFAVVTGEVGAGKTTVWHALLNKLDSTAKIALITNSHLTAKQMIMAILEEFEIPHTEKWSKVKMLSKLNEYLLEQISLGFNVILLIDEAQNLNASVLEEVRMLSNLETEKEKLLQIILMGQPELRDILRLDGLRQLRQRISMYYHLYSLDFKETCRYIDHRLKISGANGTPVFNEQALKSVFRHSEGIPRRVNAICDRALITGYIKGEKTINTNIIDEVVREIDQLVTMDRPIEVKMEV